MRARAGYADAVEKQFCNLEDRILGEIARGIRRTIQAEPAPGAWKDNPAVLEAAFPREIKRHIEEALEAAREEASRLYDAAAEREYGGMKSMHEQINGYFQPYEENELLKQQVAEAKSQAEKKLGRLVETLGIVGSAGGQLAFIPLMAFYRKTLSEAAHDLASGAFDYNSVIQRTAGMLSRSGIRTMDYAGGHSSRLPAAARREVMTGVSQLAGKISEMNAEKLGTEYFEIDRHAGARPSHQQWQGKVWSKDELVSVCGLGTAAGLKGVNCYHGYYPFIPGISERMHTDQWLAAQNRLEDTPRAYRGKDYTAYEARQKQRQMETSMRAQRQKVRMLEDGRADRQDIIIAKARYQGQLAEYRQFSDAMKLKPHMERVYIDGLGNVVSGRRPRITPLKGGKTSKISAKTAEKAVKGLGAKIGGEGLIPVHEGPALLKKIDYGSKKAVRNELKSFEKNAITEAVETACVITTNGEIYKCFGLEDRVFPDYDLKEKLKGASVSHNHTINETAFSFSKDDLRLFMEYGLDVLRGCDEKYTYEFNRHPAEIDEPMEDWMNFENYNHVNIIRLAKEYGIGYRRWKNE